MKILMVVTRGDTFGGAQSHVRDLAAGLSAAGHAVRVVAGSAGPLTAALAAAGVDFAVCPYLRRAIHPLHDARAVAGLRRSIRAFQPDLVCAHSSKAGLVGRVAARLGGVPCLFTAHGWAFTEGVPEPGRGVYRAVERLAAPLAARIVCVSGYEGRLAVEAGIAPDRLVTIHNGLPDLPACFRACPGSPGPVRVAMVARFDRQKDHRTLIEAVRGVDDVHLDLVGDGPNLEAVRRLVRDRGLTDRVSFLGSRGDVPAVLTQAHAFALSSNWEGFPLSTLEAMRAGLPVVVSDVGGAAEAVVEGVTGFAVPRGDVAAWRDRLALLARDPERRAVMGSAARRRYETEFAFDRMLERTLAAYEAVLRERVERERALDRREPVGWRGGRRGGA